jgi:hypothetical protein
LLATKLHINTDVGGTFSNRLAMLFYFVLSILPSNLSLISLLIILVGLIILWIIVSIPVYIAGKIVTAGRASLGNAMLATLLGPIVYAIVLFGVDFFLGALIGSSVFIWAFILAFIAWLAVYKSVFETGWLGALGIAILAVIVFFILSLVLAAIFGITFPREFFPRPLRLY